MLLEHGVKFEGPVKLDSADNEFHAIENYGHNSQNKDPKNIYFGRLVSLNRIMQNRLLKNTPATKLPHTLLLDGLP